MRSIVLAVTLFLAACGGQYSTVPDIAMKQKWVESCGQMGQGIQTALSLGQAGHLTEDEALVMDRVDIVYREVCTGDPAPLTDILTGVAVQAAVGALCPGIVITEDLVLTIAQAATCAARQALLLQLEAS